MSVELITGHGGIEHVDANDYAYFNAGTWGPGRYVLPTGNIFAYEIASNNLVKIKSGDLINQGRHIRIDTNDYESVPIDNGLAGVKRNDIIVFEYAKNSSTEIETATTKVIKGTSGSAAVDPAYTTGNLLTGAALDQSPMYRVRIEGLNIVAVEPLFSVAPTFADIVSGFGESLASAYSATATYTLGSYCLYNNKIYKCTTAITVAEAWTAGHWTAVSLAAEIFTLSTNLATKQNKGWSLLSSATGSTAISISALTSATEIWVRFVVAGNQAYNVAMPIPLMMLTSTSISFRLGYSNLNVTFQANTSSIKILESVLGGVDQLSTTATYVYYR